MSIALLLASTTARAENGDDATRGAARMLGYSGIEAYQAGHYEIASERLEKSFQLLEVPSLGLWSARALVKLGKLIEAHDRYATVADLSSSIGDAPVQQAARLDARKEGAELLARIPRLTVELEGARADDVLVTVDGAALSRNRLGLPLPVNPGKHVLLGSRGEQRIEISLSLVEGQRERAVLRFRPSEHGQSEAVILFAPGSISGPEAKPAGPASSPWPSVGWLTLGVGVAGLTTGAVTYVIGTSKYDEVAPACADGSNCSDDGYETVRTIHIASTIGGAVLVAVGVTVLLVTRDSGEDVALSIGPGRASLVGRF